MRPDSKFRVVEALNTAKASLLEALQIAQSDPATPRRIVSGIGKLISRCAFEILRLLRITK